MKNTLFIFFMWVSVSLHAAALRPNIVLIFVDDMGYGDLGCYGNKRNKTPNIDRLAAEGQRWTSFYSSGAVCVPSRTGLMTGRHPALFAAGRNNLAKVRDKLMAAMLKKQGYATAILGKWHLAGYPKDFSKSPMHPLECGFDYHFGTPGSNDVPAPPGKRQTRNLFDSDAFTHMKKGAIFVNTARGSIHDEEALADALASGHLGGAGLDVWDSEPPPKEHRLLDLPNVVATPHIAGYTSDSLANMAEYGATQLLQIFAGESPPRPVNPEVLPRFQTRFAQILGEPSKT